MSDISDFIPKENLSHFFEDQHKRVTGYILKHNKISEEEADEIFSAGCHAMLEAIHSGRFTTEYHEYSLVKYLHTCCKYQMLKLLEQKKKKVKKSRKDGKDFDIIDKLSEDISGYYKEEGKWKPYVNTDGDDKMSEEQKKEDLELMETILEDLPYPCKDLIWGKYKERFSAEEMAMRLGYNSNRVAITTLSRCMQKLKNRFNSERIMIDEK